MGGCEVSTSATLLGFKVWFSDAVESVPGLRKALIRHARECCPDVDDSIHEGSSEEDVLKSLSFNGVSLEDKSVTLKVKGLGKVTVIVPNVKSYCYGGFGETPTLRDKLFFVACTIPVPSISSYDRNTSNEFSCECDGPDLADLLVQKDKVGAYLTGLGLQTKWASATELQ
ncbi:hypothetical protein KIPB_010302 [Kipferlia bialata]|uniref:Uncharacterized protein n=1 Tax=Kipferlia bialata TaxID=797122 RepID=A0A9K3GMU8_9EUKA|nr:hypothetical protein KIPB_010302 [Kipferlia bialata]|eukprot:g10302.t1